jgi:hypothetical protein
VSLDDWLLTRSERGNDHTRLDARRPGDVAWSLGNRAEPLIHGATYFTELLREVAALRVGDLLLFTDWRGTRTSDWTGPARRSPPRSPRQRRAASW